MNDKLVCTCVGVKFFRAQQRDETWVCPDCLLEYDDQDFVNRNVVFNEDGSRSIILDKDLRLNGTAVGAEIETMTITQRLL